MARQKLGVGGCATCRKRRIKCDEHRPTCGNCRARGIECGGYDLNQKIKFVVQAQKTNARKSRDAPRIRSDCAALVVAQNHSQSPTTSWTESIESWSEASTPHPGTKIPSIDLALPVRELYLGSFSSFFAQLYSPVAFTVAPGHSLHSQVLKLLDRQTASPSPDIAHLVAFAIGSQNIASHCPNAHRGWFAFESLQYYSMAIAALRDALEDVNQTIESISRIAYAILMLAAYELENGKYDAWEPHIFAVGLILRRIGPRRAAEISATRSLFYYHASHARVYQLLDKVKSEFLEDAWCALYDPIRHRFMRIRAQAIRAYVHDDIAAGRKSYCALLRYEEQSYATISEIAPRIDMFRLEILTLLTVMSQLIHAFECTWAPTTLEFLRSNDAKLDINNAFLALQVVGHSVNVSKLDREWCMAKIEVIMQDKKIHAKQLSASTLSIAIEQ